MRLVSEIRGPLLISREARRTYRSLSSSQPLLMKREPNNPVDRNAIILMTLFAQPVGYMAREHAAIVAPMMDKGAVLLCRVLEGIPQILIWRDLPEKRKFTHVSKSKDGKIPELLDYL
jgi:hypothetical protein